MALHSLKSTHGFTRVAKPNWQPRLATLPRLKKTWPTIPDYIPAPGNNPNSTLIPAVFESNIPKSTAKLSSSELTALGEQARELLDKDSTYFKHTAVLFRGLPFVDGQDLKAFTAGMGMAPMEYDSVNRRRVVSGQEQDVYHTTFQAPDGMVFGGCHTELFYKHDYPRTIMFYCKAAAAVGGESLLVRNADITRNLGPAFVEMLKEKGGIRNYMFSPSRQAVAKGKRERSEVGALQAWQDVVGCEDEAGLVAYWKARGFTDFKFDDEGSITMSLVTPGWIPDPQTGAPMVLNGLTGGTKATVFQAEWANGEPIDWSVVERCRSAMWPSVVGLKLLAGDLLVMDNGQMQHGKLPHKGREREIWVHLSPGV